MYSFFANHVNMTALQKEWCKPHKYDKCIKIVIPGTPMTDSRPRVIHELGIAVSINLLKLAKIFRPMYKSSEFLLSTMVHSKYHLACNFYVAPTKEELKFINKSSKDQFLFKMDKLPNLNKRDIDNMIKVHNDLLFRDEFRVLLDDALNSGLFESGTYLSSNERAEILIFYNSKPSSFEKYKIEKLDKYEVHNFSYKLMLMNNNSPISQMKYLLKFVNNRFTLIKNNKQRIKIIKRLAKTLEEYPVDVLKEMGKLNTKHGVFTKYDAIVKIIITLLKNYKDVQEQVIPVLDVGEEVTKIDRSKRNNTSKVKTHNAGEKSFIRW